MFCLLLILNHLMVMIYVFLIYMNQSSYVNESSYINESSYMNELS